MADNIAFHNPKSLGLFDLGVTQKNKILPFTTLAGVFLSIAKVEIFSNGRLIKTYLNNPVTGTNQAANSKTLSVTFQGVDFVAQKGQTLRGVCTSFFVDGDIEMTFDLRIE